MAGRPRKPTALKIVGGNAGKRALPKNEPDPLYLNDLTPPSHLNERAAAVWTEIAPALRNAKLLTELDVPMLEIACNAIANYRHAQQQAGAALLVKSPETGNVSVSPWMIMQSMSVKQAMNALREFGMSPAARSRVIVQQQGELFDELHRFQNAG